MIETGINRDTLADASIRQRTIDLTPWGRLGRPDDIAAALTFLASADADYITGADLIVDGAMSSTINWGEAGSRILDFHSQALSRDRFSATRSGPTRKLGTESTTSSTTAS